MNFNVCNNSTSFFEEDFFSYVLQYGKFYKTGYEQGTYYNSFLKYSIILLFLSSILLYNMKGFLFLFSF